LTNIGQRASEFSYDMEAMLKQSQKPFAAHRDRAFLSLIFFVLFYLYFKNAMVKR